MSQHDFNIANQGFPAFRSDLNNALTALASNSSGDTPPSTTYANQFWYETDTNTLYFRNEDNDAWITLAVFDQTNDEWEVRTGVIQAVDSAGISLKTDEGTTRFSISDGGQVSFQNYSFPTADGSANESLVTNGSGALSFGHPDKIEEGNSSVEVVDTGTGSVRVTIDGSETARLDDDGLGISNGHVISFDKSQSSDTMGRDTSNNALVANSRNDFRINIDSNNDSTNAEFAVGTNGTDATTSKLFAVQENGNLEFNSGYGSAATAYGCRAWVNFNGIGTVAIREDGNVSSVTDVSTGKYTVNFSTAMPDANYAVTLGANPFNTSGAFAGVSDEVEPSTGSFRVDVRVSGFGNGDTDIVCCAVFR